MVRALDASVCQAMGFERSIPVSGQTYTRKIDSWVLAALADVCGSAAKFASDMRLLAHEREVDEPFEAKQIGSSAMPWKRNPMRSERICCSRASCTPGHEPARDPRNQWPSAPSMTAPTGGS